jgi:hypothetical protein
MQAWREGRVAGMGVGSGGSEGKPFSCWKRAKALWMASAAAARLAAWAAAALAARAWAAAWAAAAAASGVGISAMGAMGPRSGSRMRSSTRSSGSFTLESSGERESRLSLLAAVLAAVRAAGRVSWRFQMASLRVYRMGLARLGSSWSVVRRLRIWARANWMPARSSMAGISKMDWAGWTPRWRGAGRRVV